MIPSQRSLFGIPRDVAYLNCATLGPLMLAAREAGRRALERRGEPWRFTAADWFEDTERRRELFARLIGTSPENVALVPASSYGLAVAARNLPAEPGRRVIVLAGDFPSNVYTWRAFCERRGCELVTVERAPGQTWTAAVLAALDERVTLAALPNVHWTDGALVDLVAIAPRLRELGARLVVDASQSLGVMPFDFATVRPDFLVAVGYKWLLGPYGLSYLWVADAHLDGEPLEENWIAREGSDDFTRLEYRNEYRRGARRFDMGQRSLLEANPVAVAVLERMLGWGVPAIAATLADLTDEIARGAERLGLPLSSPGPRAPHLLGLALPRGKLAEVSRRLAERSVHVSVRNSAMRISPHVYNDREDVQRLLEALAEVPG